MDALFFGLQVAVIGIAIVFLTLVFLIYLIKFMTKLTSVSTSKKESPEPIVVVKEPVSQQEQLVPVDDSEIIAVITAVIASLTQSKTRIKTIKRTKAEKDSAWGIAGRQETMYLRQSL